MKRIFLAAPFALAGLALLTVSTKLSSCGGSGTKDDDTVTTTTDVKGNPALVSSEHELKELIAFGEGNHKYTVEDFFRNPEKTRYQISPNGDYLSYMAPYETRMNVFVQKIGEDKSVRVTSETERDIAGYFWGNNNRIIYLKDKGGDENYHLYAVNTDGKDAKDLTPFDSVTVQVIDDLRDIEDEMIISHNKRNKQVFDPYRLNIRTGEMTMLYENPGNITQWMTDHAGKLRIAVVTDGVNTTLLHRATESEDFAPVITTDFRQTLQPQFFTFDNKNVYASSNLGRDKDAIVVFDLAAAKEVGKPLFEHPEVDAWNLNYSRKRKVITSAVYVTDKRGMKFFDAASEQMYNRIKNELSDYEIAITSTNRAEDKFLVRTYSDRSLGAYYFYDKNTDTLSKVTDVSPWIDENDMTEMRPIKYKSRDGLTINGYLTIPKGSDGKNLPVVVNPHGGPWARDFWGFNPEVQLLASRGYAVLQMNFRGSTGYGRAFWEASFKQWGKTMQDDITDGVKWLIAEGIADPNRIAIYGGSYGGYATLAGVTFTPDLYRCAVDYVGVANLFTFMETIPPYWEPYRKMMYEMVGNPDDPADSALMHSASPVYHVDRIKAPLLILQGANDPRVNINESDQVVQALKDKGIDVPYLVKYDEGHGFHNEENRIEGYKVMTGFLARYLKAGELEG